MSQTVEIMVRLQNKLNVSENRFRNRLRSCGDSPLTNHFENCKSYDANMQFLSIHQGRKNV